MNASKNPSGTFGSINSGLLLKLGTLLAFDLFSIWFMSRSFGLGYTPLTVVLAVITLLINLVFLWERLQPMRWMAVGFAFMTMFAIYPILFTVWVAFTNYGDGHLLTQEQALNQILSATYLPESGKAYRWTAFKDSENNYALWLLDAEGSAFLVKPGEPITPGVSGQNGVGALDANGIPTEITGYTRLNAVLAAADKNLPNVLFGAEGSTIQVRSPSEAAELKPRYQYDEATDTLTDQQSGTTFIAVDGTYRSQTGQTITPGFMAPVGFTNFSNFFTSSAMRGPLLRIITWNFAFAFLSVLLTFSMGLAVALMFNDPKFPGRRIIRSFLLIPYTIPGLITILIWRGMLNPELGVINNALREWFNFSPPWFTDGTWAKIAILLINTWLGYPYFMLICSGALQSIPDDIYAAAEVDGASTSQKFWRITLPLLLVAVGPLMVASFTYNFNNFNLIYLFIGGGPPIAGSPTAAGHTDILISYVYNLAFAGGRGVNYGFASAISIVIFFIVATITLFQFRFTRMWEEVSENV